MSDMSRAVYSAVNKLERPVGELVEAQLRKAKALEGLNERIDDILAFGLLVLNMETDKRHPDCKIDVVNRFGEIRKILKDRKI